MDPSADEDGVDNMAVDEEADPLEVLDDLQIEVGALRRIVELLLAQHLLNSGAPHVVLEQLEKALSTAYTVITKSLTSSDDREYVERVHTETKSIVEQAAVLMRAMLEEISKLEKIESRQTSGYRSRT